MLVLSRKSQQKIILSIPQGDGSFETVEIIVLSLENEAGGKKVRLGINAPRSITIDREEIHKERLLNRDDGIEKLVDSLLTPAS